MSCFAGQAASEPVISVLLLVLLPFALRSVLLWNSLGWPRCFGSWRLVTARLAGMAAVGCCPRTASVCTAGHSRCSGLLAGMPRCTLMSEAGEPCSQVGMGAATREGASRGCGVAGHRAAAQEGDVGLAGAGV